MLHYRPFELHNHTKHSDGQFTVPELCRASKAYGYDGIALTDHNATTAILDVTEALLKETELLVLPGIEWTTFYGHLCVLGCKYFIDWRFVTPDTIDDALEQIQEAGGIAGIAHPCEVGAPLMCGCNWEFQVSRWDLVSYIEVWSQESPMARAKNQLALPWYDKLLGQGHRLAVSAGRDWHVPDTKGSIPLLTATYLGLEGALTQESALEALRKGRTYITLGPTLEIVLLQANKQYFLGDSALQGQATVSVSVGEDNRKNIWASHAIKVQKIRLIVNGVPVEEQDAAVTPIKFVYDFPKGWLRVELYGNCDGETEQLLALTSPIYIEKMNENGFILE